jgi:hypothetical protein
MNRVLSSEQKSDLDRDGFCLVTLSHQEWLERGVNLDKVTSAIDDLTDKEDWRGGYEHISENIIEGVHPEPGAQRLNNLLNKDPSFRKLFTIPEILDVSQTIIKVPICLSSMISRTPAPGNGAQNLHIDWTPRKKLNDPYRSVISIILLDDVTKESGPTRFVPGSHKILGEPKDFGYGNKEPHPEEVLLEAPRGTIFMFNGHLWHSGTACKNGKKRRQIFINYRDRKVWQSLNMKKFSSPEFISSLNEYEKFLLKVRPEDPSQIEWLFKKRNNKFIKIMSEILWKFKDT